MLLLGHVGNKHNSSVESYYCPVYLLSIRGELRLGHPYKFLCMFPHTQYVCLKELIPRPSWWAVYICIFFFYFLFFKEYHVLPVIPVCSGTVASSTASTFVKGNYYNYI